MNCANREAVLDMAGRRFYRCSLDREMRVNRRMHCQEWSDQLVIRPSWAVGVSGLTEKTSTDGRTRRR